MKQFRQGDVFLTKITTAPTAGKSIERENGRVVLAHGEVTGHAHAIAEPDVEMYQGADGNLYIHVGTTATVRHEEHGTILLDAGDYRVTRQREYSPVEIRQVRD